MTLQTLHTVHIPVMGTAFTIDTPVKVAMFGISSVMSIGDDELCETMREHYSQLYSLPYEPIKKWDEDYRARRITEYLNLVDDIVVMKFSQLKQESFDSDQLNQYFEMLPEQSPVKLKYGRMLQASNEEKLTLQNELRAEMKMGSLDVNIMTKLDRDNFTKDNQPLPEEFSDALSALRGFANSKLRSGIVFSAGFNRRLYAYITQFADFFPDENGVIKKKIILKVSDYRSSLTQGKFLAKKGVWVSEHRIESGLNCGGHAFASEGYLLGPIMEEFKSRRQELFSSLLEVCNEGLLAKGRPIMKALPETRITVQGGIGTAQENQFLFDYYDVDGTGWATPFLLVPEVTNVDPATRELLKNAKREDLYLSDISPLGVPFNTIRGTESEKQKLERAEKGRPGSPCPKAHLVSNTEFTPKPVCTASTLYQKRKIEQLKTLNLSEPDYQEQFLKVINKACLCEDLAAAVLINNQIDNKRPLRGAICPGPNLAYFSSRFYSMKEMLGHIYGRIHILNDTYRPNMFISELKMYIDYLAKEFKKTVGTPSRQQLNYLRAFKQNLTEGIDYYKGLAQKLNFRDELMALKEELDRLIANNQHFFAAQVALTPA